MGNNAKLIVVRRKDTQAPEMYLQGGHDLGASARHAIVGMFHPPSNNLDKGLFRASRKLRFRQNRTVVKSVLGDTPDSGGRWFGQPTRGVGEVGDHATEVAMHKQPPTHMSSNAMRWAHTFLNNHHNDFPGKLITPNEIIKKAQDARLFPKSEISTVLGSHGLDPDTPIHPKDFLERIDERKSEFNPAHNIHLQVRQIPYHTTNLPNMFNSMFHDFRDFTEHDHVRSLDSRGALRQTYSPDSYRVHLLWAPHLGPDEGHFPYQSHGTHGVDTNPHEAIAHARSTTHTDPKTGMKILSVHETQSDALQQGRGQREYVTDENGDQVVGHFGAPELKTKPFDSAIGDFSDWYKPMLNVMIAHALQTGHDGIELNSPAIMNGVWVRPSNRQAAMHTHYRLKQPEHLERVAKQFGASVEYVPQYLDYNEPDSIIPNSPRVRDSDAEQMRNTERFRNTLRFMAAKHKLPEIDPNNLFGNNVMQDLEALFKHPAPAKQRFPENLSELAAQARRHGMKNEDGEPMRSNDLLSAEELMPILHHLYHLDSRKFRMPTLPPVGELGNLSEEQKRSIDPEMLFLAEKNPVAYEQVRNGPQDKPVIVKSRLVFNDGMRDHHARQGFGLWGLSGPEVNQNIERTAAAKRVPAEKKQFQPGGPSKDEWAALREEQRRSGVPVNDLLQNGWLARYRAGNA